MSQHSVIGREVAGIMMLVAIATSGVAFASEIGDAHQAAVRRITVLDENLILPSALTMRQDDVLEFQNLSGQFMRLTFVEPEDQADKIRCHPTDNSVERPDVQWMHFDWAAGGRLRASIPPGSVTSVCTLAPGRYALVVRRVSRDARAGEELLGTKATITVQ